jgi:hypothetical protein
MNWKDMLSISFNQTEIDLITMKLDPAIVRTDEGKLVKVSADATVALCAAEDVFFGRLYKVDTAGDVGSIQSEDFMVDVPFTGNPVLGYQKLVANGAGGVKPPADAGNGRPVDVVSIDEAAGTLIMKMCC